MKLNLGCGDKLLLGYVNVDVCGNPDMKCDLSVFPWPFSDGCAEEVYSEHFLEHVVDFERTILEMHRILKSGGILHFKVPHFRSYAYPWHLHHYAFSTYTCRLLCAQRPYLFGGVKLFDFKSLRINYVYVRPFLKKVLTSLANIAPDKWDWVGLPIDEIEFQAIRR